MDNNLVEYLVGWVAKNQAHIQEVGSTTTQVKKNSI